MVRAALLALLLITGCVPASREDDGSAWLAVDTDPRELLGGDVDLMQNEPFPDLWPCWDPNPQPRLQWSQDGELHFDHAHWDHTLSPTQAEDTWLGGFSPQTEPSEACLEASRNAA